MYNYGWHDESLTVTKAQQVYHETFEAKEKHFEELINRCKTQEDRNRFYWEMLRLLLVDNEKESKRNLYYQYDKDFMKQDRKRLFKEKIINGFWRRVLKIKDKLTDKYENNK